MDINTLEAVVKKVTNSSVHQVTVSEGDQSITVVNRSQFCCPTCYDSTKQPK